MYFDWPQFLRCCFCMPLRRGVLVMAYIKILFSALMVGVYSYAVHDNHKSDTIPKLRGFTTDFLPAELCILTYCAECVFTALLIYGAHRKMLSPVKIYYYFSICTFLVTLLIEIMELVSLSYAFFLFELVLFYFIGLSLQLYLLILVWSLMKKLEVDGPHVYENRLHQIANGQVNVKAIAINSPSIISAEV